MTIVAGVIFQCLVLGQTDTASLYVPVDAAGSPVQLTERITCPVPDETPTAVLSMAVDAQERQMELRRVAGGPFDGETVRVTQVDCRW